MPQSPPQHQGLRVNRKQQQKEYNQKKRTGQGFYNSGAWRKLRNWFIKANPLCVECKKLGVITQANIVDHITPIKNGGEKLSSQNLQGLCHWHHNVKTANDLNGGQV